MKFYLNNEQTDNMDILLERSIWTGKTTLKVNGRELQRIKRNIFSYKDKDGNEMDARVKGNEIIGFELFLGDRQITILRKLNIFELILVFIPIALIILGGGAIGGACAALGMIAIATFCRNIKNIFGKIAFALLVYVGVFLTWYFLASVVLSIV